MNSSEIIQSDALPSFARPQDDLRNIRAYLVREGGIGLARYVLGQIRQTMQVVAQTPGVGHSREDLTDEPAKVRGVFSYLIVYDPAARPVSIARVLHGNRDLASLFRDRPPRA